MTTAPTFGLYCLCGRPIRAGVSLPEHWRLYHGRDPSREPDTTEEERADAV